MSTSHRSWFDCRCRSCTQYYSDSGWRRVPEVGPGPVLVLLVGDPPDAVVGVAGRADLGRQAGVGVTGDAGDLVAVGPINGVAQRRTVPGELDAGLAVARVIRERLQPALAVLHHGAVVRVVVGVRQRHPE